MKMKIGEAKEMIKVCSDCVHGRGYSDLVHCCHPSGKFSLPNIDIRTAEKCKFFQVKPDLERPRVSPVSRKIIGIAGYGDKEVVVALCNDGTTWELWRELVDIQNGQAEYRDSWRKLPPIPQDE